LVNTWRFTAGKEIRVTGDTVTKGDTTFYSKEGIVVNADVTTDSGTLIFHADSDVGDIGTVYDVATGWVNQGAFAPDASSVKLVGPSSSVV